MVLHPSLLLCTMHDLISAGAAITATEVSWRQYPSSNTWSTASVTSSSTTHSITSLNSGTQYEIRIRCQNSVGSSDHSLALRVYTNSAVGVAEDMTPALGVSSGGTSITFTGRFNPDSTHTCRVQVDDGSGSTMDVAVSATVGTHDDTLTCTMPALTLSIDCAVVRQQATISITGLNNIDQRSFYFNYYNASCITLTAVNPQEGPSQGGYQLQFYDTANNGDYWAFLVPGSVDKSQLRCRFGGNTQVDAAFLNGLVQCTAASHAAGTVSVDLSLDTQHWLTGLSFVYTPCSAGSYAATIADTCQLCQAGYYSRYAGATACLSCGIGNFTSTVGSTTCLQCAIGTYSSSLASVACPSCGTGRYAPGIGGTTCLPCVVGFYNQGDGAGSCNMCSEGRYTDTEAQSSCRHCEAGKSGPNVGLSTCVFCRSGKFANTESNTACSDCTAGRFAGANGTSAECTLCVEGQYNNDTGRTNCDACAQGQYASIPGSRFCLDCNEGKAAGGQGTHECTQCSKGKYSAQTGSSSILCAPVPTPLLELEAISFCCRVVGMSQLRRRYFCRYHRSQHMSGDLSARLTLTLTLTLADLKLSLSLNFNISSTYSQFTLLFLFQ